MENFKACKQNQGDHAKIKSFRKEGNIDFVNSDFLKSFLQKHFNVD